MMVVRANEGVEEMVVVVLPLGAVVKAFADVSKRRKERIDFIFYQTVYVALRSVIRSVVLLLWK